MKKLTTLSLVCTTALLSANEINKMDSIEVSHKVNMKVVKNISSEEIKSADLAETLSKKIPSVTLVRRSGIANDVILRGAKKDNINVLIDESKIYGACPNRMDPTTSHVLTNNIESVEVIEGPFDIENFGTLSGNIKVKTKEPKKELSGDINLNVGSFGYKKASTTITGGNDKVKLLISASKEQSDEYKDGNGDDFNEQLKKNGVLNGNLYKETGKKLEAYDKKTVLVKAQVNIDDSSQLNLSYTLNDSDNVLYPNTPMDADYDTSKIYNVSYTKRDLGKYSKELKLESYYSKVDHPMSTKLRNNAAMSKEKTNNMFSSIKGVKIKNSMNIDDAKVLIGVDYSSRNWKGHFSNNVSNNIGTSIPSTDTENKAVFTKYEKTYGNLDVEVGLRADFTSIDTVDATKQDNDYNSLNGYIFTVYNTQNTKYFAGLGKSSRVPDARELYYTGAGDDKLEQVKNYEVDLGIEKTFGMSVVKGKVFYSKLEDYIYNNNGFKNIDASIYGAELSGFSLLTDELSLDYGLSYLKGKKDDKSQNDKDLAEIPPLKANIELNYERGKSLFTTQVVASKSWSNYDSDNGEQKLPGYAVVNSKYNYKFNKNFDGTLGVDNILNKTYASSNTYKDITLVQTGAGERILLNNPGRYYYLNLKYSF